MLANSLWRKLLATLVVAIGFVWLYEVTILDSRFAAKQAESDTVPPPMPGPPAVLGDGLLQGQHDGLGREVRSGHCCR